MGEYTGPPAYQDDSAAWNSVGQRQLQEQINMLKARIKILELALGIRQQPEVPVPPAKDEPYKQPGVTW